MHLILSPISFIIHIIPRNYHELKQSQLYRVEDLPVMFLVSWVTMEACFCHRITNKKGNCDFLSHNSDFFFLTIVRCKVRIVRYKVRIA